MWCFPTLLNPKRDFKNKVLIYTYLLLVFFAQKRRERRKSELLLECSWCSLQVSKAPRCSKKSQPSGAPLHQAATAAAATNSLSFSFFLFFFLFSFSGARQGERERVLRVCWRGEGGISNERRERESLL